MSPLPSPEERRKKAKILGLDSVGRRSVGRPGVSGTRSAAADERARQQKEGRKRAKEAQAS